MSRGIKQILSTNSFRQELSLMDVTILLQLQPSLHLQPEVQESLGGKALRAEAIQAIAKPTISSLTPFRPGPDGGVLDQALASERLQMVHSDILPALNYCLQTRFLQFLGALASTFRVALKSPQSLSSCHFNLIS